MTLSNVQQHLLSYFMLTKVTHLDSALKILREALSHFNINKPSSEGQLFEEVLTINHTIKEYGLEVVKSIDELTGDKLFILINTADNLLTRKSKFYDQQTYNFFSLIIKECILSEEGSLSELDCLNLSNEIKMRKTTAETVLEHLVKDKWLLLENGTIYLGMRSIVELEHNIKQLYPDDVKHCPLCKLLVVQGFICKNCKVRCHYACCKKYVAKSKRNCPSCNESWDDAPSELINESFHNQDDIMQTSLPTPAKRRKKTGGNVTIL